MENGNPEIKIGNPVYLGVPLLFRRLLKKGGFIITRSTLSHEEKSNPNAMQKSEYIRINIQRTYKYIQINQFQNIKMIFRKLEAKTCENIGFPGSSWVIMRLHGSSWARMGLQGVFKAISREVFFWETQKFSNKITFGLKSPSLVLRTSALEARDRTQKPSN